MVSKSAFTLIELVVVIGVMAIIASVMLVNFPYFRREVNLEREASRLVLALRKAQSYALAVREFEGGINDDPFCKNPPVKFPPYGVYFAISNPDSYVLFGDTSCSGQYEPFPAYSVEEMVERIKFEGGILISSIRAYDVSTCSEAVGGCVLEEFAALYRRPGPTTVLTSDGMREFNFAEIFISFAGSSDEKKIIIRSTGQVSIE